MKEFETGDMLRAKMKRTVPVNFKNKHLIVIQGPKQKRMRERNPYSNPRFQEFTMTIWEVYCVEDAKYYEFDTGYLRDYFKLEHRPQKSESH